METVIIDLYNNSINRSNSLIHIGSLLKLFILNMSRKKKADYLYKMKFIWNVLMYYQRIEHYMAKKFYQGYRNVSFRGCLETFTILLSFTSAPAQKSIVILPTGG